ncbi:hypothetical protein C2845_PM05G27060 [Panicum miliaceum]|uniref:Uncharacterized protein n=1 Tax=Panicum miliaceum TaxID=4540 RepID=A0A3L6SU44_PANMI|nr:hypothetical protein C2845_PM05G27060 [Panicum miliaceum]
MRLVLQKKNPRGAFVKTPSRRPPSPPHSPPRRPLSLLLLVAAPSLPALWFSATTSPPGLPFSLSVCLRRPARSRGIQIRRRGQRHPVPPPASGEVARRAATTGVGGGEKSSWRGRTSVLAADLLLPTHRTSANSPAVDNGSRSCSTQPCSVGTNGSTAMHVAVEMNRLVGFEHEKCSGMPAWRARRRGRTGPLAAWAPSHGVMRSEQRRASPSRLGRWVSAMADGGLGAAGRGDGSAVDRGRWVWATAARRTRGGGRGRRRRRGGVGGRTPWRRGRRATA